MKVQIRERQVEVSDVLRTHVQQRLGLALGRFGDRIGQVVVRFSLVGLERRCEIDVLLRPRRVQVADTDADPFAAVDRAAERTSGVVDRELERQRDWEEHPVRPLR